jgi:hypothetical protein
MHTDFAVWLMRTDAIYFFPGTDSRTILNQAFNMYYFPCKVFFLGWLLTGFAVWLMRTDAIQFFPGTDSLETLCIFKRTPRCEDEALQEILVARDSA